MNKNSNSYIFIYASVMVVLVAVILTSANLALKPLQKKNKENEKMMNLLKTIGIEADASTALDLYNKHLIKEVIINKEGEEISTYQNGELNGNIRAFNVNLKSALNDIEKKGIVAMPIFLMQNNGEKFYIIPVYGKGLWGPISGNVSLKEDKNTIAAVTFDHEGETPGLGAEIVKDAFTSQFIGKEIFKDNKFVSISVIKGGVASQHTIDALNGVDAISGSTLTCNGVNDMLKTCISNYINYLNKGDN